jgi:hypothetical protein
LPILAKYARKRAPAGITMRDLETVSAEVKKAMEDMYYAHSR